MSDNWKSFLVGVALVFVVLPFNNEQISEGLLVFVDTTAFGIAGASSDTFGRAGGGVWACRSSPSGF